jgi:hypothetical protein
MGQQGSKTQRAAGEPQSLTKTPTGVPGRDDILEAESPPERESGRQASKGNLADTRKVSAALKVVA